MKKIMQYVCLIFLLFYGMHLEKQDNKVLVNEKNKAITVTFEGAVGKEGIYTFEDVITVEEALKKVGLKEDARIVDLNLKAMIQNKMVVYVPFEKEGLISLNQASLEEIDTVPGIGPKKANAIIEARPYTCLEDLLKVKGIGEKSYRQYRTYFCL